MKKIFTTILLASMMLTAHADLGLCTSHWDEDGEEVITYITKDTTIVVSEFEEDFISGKDMMALEGYITPANKKVNVTIERSVAGTKDQFCLGNCYEGNGQLKQEHAISLFTAEGSWQIHFYPTEPSTTTIVYTFSDGVNPAIAVTVQFCYLVNAVESVTTTNNHGKIYNLLGQEMPTNVFSELPHGIYIINGKKYIKQ